MVGRALWGGAALASPDERRALLEEVEAAHAGPGSSTDDGADWGHLDPSRSAIERGSPTPSGTARRSVCSAWRTPPTV